MARQNEHGATFSASAAKSQELLDSLGSFLQAKTSVTYGMTIKGTPAQRRALMTEGAVPHCLITNRLRYLQTGPASLVKVLLFENHPLTAMDGAP